MADGGNVVPAHLAHVPPGSLAGLAKANAGKPLAALNGDPTSILARLYDGESAPQIAKSLGIHHTALYAWLLTYCPEEWRAASAARQLSRLEAAEDALNDPLATPDNVSVTRSQAAAKLAQWGLERTTKLYADAKNDNSGVTVQVLIARDGEVQSIVKTDK